MAVKKHSGKTELRQWMDEQYRTSPGLKERVEALVEEMSIEQGLVALRQERGLSQRALADLVGARVKILLEKSQPAGRARRTKRKLAKTA